MLTKIVTHQKVSLARFGRELESWFVGIFDLVINVANSIPFLEIEPYDKHSPIISSNSSYASNPAKYTFQSRILSESTAIIESFSQHSLCRAPTIMSKIDHLHQSQPGLVHIQASAFLFEKLVFSAAWWGLLLSGVFINLFHPCPASTVGFVGFVGFVFFVGLPRLSCWTLLCRVPWLMRMSLVPLWTCLVGMALTLPYFLKKSFWHVFLLPLFCQFHFSVCGNSDAPRIRFIDHGYTWQSR